MRNLFALLVTWGCLGLASALAQPTNSFPLWADGAPGALGKEEKDIPTLTPYWPESSKASGAAMVVCPGGGYGGLAGHEGKDYALWFNEQGIAAFVLKYRLGSAGYRHPVMLQDAARAVRTVRANATAWKIDTKRIGIIGSSAGGHLASTLVTHFDAGNPEATDPIERVSSRPDLGILCYPVITLGEFTHQGSKQNLLGKEPAPERVRLLSNEVQVTPQTPPCAVWSTGAGTAVPVESPLQFAAAMRTASVPCDLHVYLKGPHGIGLGRDAWTPSQLHPWTYDCSYFLKTLEFKN